MSSNEVSWQSAFWSLPPLAINSMMQPSGRVCGFDPTLRTYLRSSPIVCVFDAVAILLRFIIYRWHEPSAPVAAKKVLAARRASDEEAELGGIRSLEQVLFLRVVWFVIGVLPQAIKLVACSGLLWTKVWGFFYVGSFLVIEAMNILSSFAIEDLNPIANDLPERWLTRCEQVSGAMAVLIQLAFLAWVDLAVIPPDPKFIRKWTFRLIRFSAHFIVFLIHLPLMALQSDAPTPSPNRRLGGLVMSMLLIFILLIGFDGLHFSRLYFMWSIIISSFAWLLYFFPVTRNHVLLCEPGDRGHRNVLAFDFFCRILCFSLFWYFVHYDPSGTFKPQWTNVLG